MQRATPVSQKLDKFDEHIFSDLDTEQSIQDELDQSLSSIKPEKLNTGRRRTKAERVKTRGKDDKPQLEKRQGAVLNKNSSRNQLGATPSSSSIHSKTTNKDFSKTMKVDKIKSNDDKLNGKPRDLTKVGSFKQKNDGVVEKTKLNKKMQNKNIRYDKGKAARAEKNRKSHIAYLARNCVNKAKIVDFARMVAATKIQRAFRNFVEDRRERERIRFEQAQKQCRKNLARATIRKYATIYLVNKREKRENLEFHEKYNLEHIKYLQIKYRAWKARPNKINVPRFKQVFFAYLIGWKTRRILSYLQTVPAIREAMDYIKLRNDIKGNDPNDLFSKQIIEKYPEMTKIFHDKFHDLVENAIWIKKPNSKTPTKSKESVSKPVKERSKPTKIPAKPVKYSNGTVSKRKSLLPKDNLPSTESKPKKRNTLVSKPQLGTKKSENSNGDEKVN